MGVGAGKSAMGLGALWDVRDLARRLGEPGSDGFHRSWIMLFPEGEFSHPEYGHLAFSRARLANIKRLFDRRVRHIDVALDANHDQDKATGWLERLELREAAPAPAAGDGAPPGETPAGLWGLVRWTPLGLRYLKDQIYRYFSPEFGPWTDPETGHEYQDVLLGGGLTNRPFLKTMGAVQLAERLAERLAEGVTQRITLQNGRKVAVGARLRRTECPSCGQDADSVTKSGYWYRGMTCPRCGYPFGAKGHRAERGRPSDPADRPEALADGASGAAAVSRRPWGRVDKACLPDSAFLDPANRRLPVYEGAGDKDARGRYTERGPLNINAVVAALAAIHGARSGRPMSGVPSGVVAKLEAWKAKYLDGDDAAQGETTGTSKAASDGTRRRAAHGEGTSMAGKKPNGATGAAAERDELLLADRADDDAEQYADDEDDGAEMDDGGDEGGDTDADEGSDDDSDSGDGDVDGDEDTHGPVTVKGHSHGKYARHSHSNDGDHSDAPLKEPKGGAKSMREGLRAGTTRRAAARPPVKRMSLAEMGEEVTRLREQNARVEFQLYEAEVGRTLEGWAKQQFQFAEHKRGRAGAIAISKRFGDAYKAFMLREGVRLSPTQRRAISALVESALSTAIVDLSERGGSFDMESRQARGVARGGAPIAETRAAETAMRLAEEEHLIPGGLTFDEAQTHLAKLPHDKQLDLYSRAHRVAAH